MAKIKNGFAYMGDSILETRAQSIVIAMTGNVNFTTPIPTMGDVESAVEAYSEALLGAQTRDKTKVAQKRVAKTNLVNILKILGNYVTLTAMGDEAKLVSSGFELASPGVPRPPITAPQNLQVESGINSGSIKVSIDAVANARSYLFEYTEEPITETSVWTSVATTSRAHTFANLTIGQKYWFRVGACGVRGQLVYSAAMDKVVQ
jgi:hypothetical protein